MLKVAIQGYRGCFHEIAAKKYFGNKVQIVSCDTFNKQFEYFKSKKVDKIIMAIENSVAGSLLPNYSLLRQNNVRIIGETYLHISQNLMALPNQKLEDIKEIRSHYMAIEQCRKFLNQYPNKKITVCKDTALSAKEIYEKKTMGVAAIAGKLAADMYNLKLLETNIETNKRNYTRFLIVAGNEEIEDTTNEVDKASICFTLPHIVGSLAKVLSIFAFYNIDLTKIQSLPIVGQEWNYLFYVDLCFDSYSKYIQALNAVKPLTETFENLGEYKSEKR